MLALGSLDLCTEAQLGTLPGKGLATTFTAPSQ